MPEVLEPPVQSLQHANPSYFTPERARELAKKSLASRLDNAAKMKEAAAITDSLSLVVSAQGENSEVFKLSVLARIRKQIDVRLKELDGMSDPASVDKHTRSLDTLMEQERKLSGRSLPPTVKPRSGKDSKRQPSVTETPEQVASPDQAKPPVPIIASYSVEELQEALRLKLATVTDTVTDTVTPPLTSVTESNQTDLLRRTENGQ